MIQGKAARLKEDVRIPPDLVNSVATMLQVVGG